MAAAIITPASEDLDSRTSSVCIALPAPSAISSASPSRPASRQAAAGSFRNRLRNSASASRRSISRAATSASLLATGSSLPQTPALAQRLDEHDDHRDEEGDPERPHHAVRGRLVGSELDQDLLI